jgi:hypothetical protein
LVENPKNVGAFVELQYVLTSLVPIRNGHVEIKNDEIEHVGLFSETRVIPVVNHLIYVLLLIFHGFRGILVRNMAIGGCCHFEIMQLHDDFHHV